MGREQILTIAYMWIYLLLTLIVHMAHFLVVILISWENYSDVWQTDLSLGPADRHIVVLVLSETYKSLKINSAGLYELQKRWGFPLLWCCMDSPSSHDPSLHCLSVEREATVCIGLCMKSAVLIHEHLKVAPHESCSVWDSEHMLSRFWGCVVVKPASGRD